MAIIGADGIERLLSHYGKYCMLPHHIVNTQRELTRIHSIYLVGEAVLFATSALAPSMTTAKTTGFALAMVLVSIGVGGTKPNLSALLGECSLSCLSTSG